jgi:tetratricopeptide (TPR) repeat protein
MIHSKLIDTIRIYVFAAVVLFKIVGFGYTQELEENALKEGMDYTNKGRYDEAIVEFTSVITINPKNAAAYYHRGLAYQKKDKLDKAILDYTKAIEINPRNADFYFYRGVAYYYNGKPDQAIDDWSKAIELSPNSADIYQKRAFAYFKKQEYYKSWEDVHKVEALGYQVQPKFLEDLKKASMRDD